MTPPFPGPRKPLPPEVVAQIERVEKLIKATRVSSLPPQLGPDVLLRAKQSLDRAPAFSANPMDAVMTAYLNRNFPIPTVPTTTRRPRLRDRLWSRIQQIRYFLFRLRRR